MPGAFQYKPKFVDIRVRPPAEEDRTEEDVHALKPGERACDHPGCRLAATARAPKARDMLHEHYWFCQPHAAEYNRNWNFFAGLSDAEVRRRQTEELMTGGRPTWDMKAGRMSREAALWLNASILVAYLAASTAPSPLYALYRELYPATRTIAHTLAARQRFATEDAP